jgi:glycosyltransferase involved in cell wall biosynthesis
MKIRASIIMPVKNGENFIKETLLSLIENISQEDEIIIIDDGSTDNTVKIINNFSRKFKVSVLLVHGSNLLPSGARNKGLEIAHGEYISFIDHDDLWPKNRLNHHLNLLSNLSHTDVIQGRVKYFSTTPSKLDIFDFLDKDHTAFFWQLGSFTFKSNVFKKIGAFNPELKFGEDVDLYTKVLDGGYHIHKDEEIALHYRLHETNMTNDYSENNNRVLLKILSASIKRKKIKEPLS